MLELKQAPLMVNRSYSGVLKAAYDLLTDNFKKTFKHIWVYSLIFSCVLALYFMFSINTMINGANAMALAVISPFMLIADILFYARALMPLNGKGMKWNSLRVVKFGVAFVVVLVVVGILGGLGMAGFMGSLTRMLVYVSIMSTVIMFLLVPFQYICMKYYMEPLTHIHKIIFSGYKTGFRHWGLQFITMLLAGLALSCVSVVISLPLIIVYAALAFSLQGVVNGDEAGIPGYFNAITFVAAAITYFVATFMALYTLYISYYLYGSIETREKEKKEITQTAQK